VLIQIFLSIPTHHYICTVQQYSLHAGSHSQRARTLTTALCAAVGNSLHLVVGMPSQKFWLWGWFWRRLYEISYCKCISTRLWM